MCSETISGLTRRVQPGPKWRAQYAHVHCNTHKLAPTHGECLTGLFISNNRGRAGRLTPAVITSSLDAGRGLLQSPAMDDKFSLERAQATATATATAPSSYETDVRGF